jgi:FixJ family two-component response regulator
MACSTVDGLRESSLLTATCSRVRTIARCDLPGENPLQDTLTPRENAVLALIMQGATSKVAGGVLGVSRRTIEFHRANIMLKLSAKNVADLMRIVLEKKS